MFVFLKDLWLKLKDAKLYKKVLVCFSMLIWLALILVCLIQVSYTVVTPGLAHNASSRLEITTDEFKENEKGQIYTLAVYSDNKVSVLRYLLSKMNPKYEVTKYDSKTDQSDFEEGIAGTIMMDLSTTKAIICAYTEASKVNPEIKISYSFKGMIVEQISHTRGDSQLVQGDIITHVKGVEVTSEKHFWQLFNRNNIENNRLLITVKRGDTIKDLNLYLQSSDDGGYYVGFYSEAYYVIDEENTYPKYDIKSTNTIGPSGGLLQSLSIYNLLFSDDITKGKVVVGTGTIELKYDEENNLYFTGGKIGAIKQKIITAYECSSINNIDVFFVDEGDYEEALAAYNEYAHNAFDLVKVTNFSDIINYFKEVE